MDNSKSNENDFSDLRKKAEESLYPAKKNKQKITPDIEHDLNVYEMELKIQNEELLSTQAKLTSSLREYEELFELSPAGYFILDKDGIVKKVNEKGCLKVGVEKSKIIGKSFSSFLSGEINQDNFYRHRHLVLESESAQELECEIQRKDGSTFLAILKSLPIMDDQHNLKHFLVIVTDISKIKEHERHVEIALRESQELNQMKSQFITMASHEFRTPLSTVLSSTFLIEQYIEAGNKEETKKHFARIRSSVKDLTIILDEFLSLEKLESGKIEIMPKKFNLPDFCNEIISEVSALMKKGQRINFKHVGKKEVRADEKIVKHILQNLLSNACKYSKEEKEIDLYTEIKDTDILIKVSDKGIGIPAGDQKNLFTRFFRAKNVVSIQGTGLGLNIVKQYVELLNGTITFTSEQNIGTTFVVKFPMTT